MSTHEEILYKTRTDIKVVGISGLLMGGIMGSAFYFGGQYVPAAILSGFGMLILLISLVGNGVIVAIQAHAYLSAHNHHDPQRKL